LKADARDAAPQLVALLKDGDVGRPIMTLIHTYQLCGANSFDYMIECQRHAGEHPSEWMPWNYRDTLQRFLTG
jgi:hypothetical protein